jgi:hypothetical protein
MSIKEQPSELICLSSVLYHPARLRHALGLPLISKWGRREAVTESDRLMAKQH